MTKIDADLTAIDHNFPTKTTLTRRWGYKAVEVEVPIVDHLDARVLQAIEHEAASSGARVFNMCHFNSGHHTCGTSHCLAGWYIVLAGQQGQRLWESYSSQTAAELIFDASCPGQDLPTFDANLPDITNMTNDEWDAEQLEALRARAAADPLADPSSWLFAE